MKTVRVGIIDSGLHESLLASVAAQARFSGAEGDPLPVEPTRLAHGSDVARLVLQGCPSARLYNAQVFDRRLDASVDAVVLALGWLVAQGVDLVNMSFGIPTASQALEAACWEAHRAGVLLVAAAPARGGPVHPAACRACMAVSGDARCGPGEVAWLGMQEADFGVHPFRVDGCLSAGGGASYAAARFSGQVAALIARGVSPRHIRSYMYLEAAWVGPERRRA